MTLRNQEPARQFAFICARGLAAWLTVMLVQQALQLVWALKSMVESEDVGVSGFLSEFNVVLWIGLVLTAIAFRLWSRADRFSALLVDGIRPGEPTTRLPWEAPVVYALGLWLVLESLPGLGGLLARLAQWREVSQVLSMDPGGFFDGYLDLRSVVTTSVRALLGLLVMINVGRIVDWSRSPGAAKPPEDHPA